MKAICKITFDGLNFEKLLNTLNREGISVLKAKKTSKLGCEIVIYALFCQKVVALLQQKCYNNIYVSNLGWLAIKQKCIQHVAFFVAICLLVPMLWVSSAFCLRVEVDSTLPTAEVVDALNQFGIKRGMLIKNVDCKSLSNKLASQLNASYVMVDKQGSTLFVKIIDAQVSNPPINLAQPSNVVALCDGVITRMVVVQGNALVKVGDTVVAGQVLVEGKRMFSDGTYQPVCAVAQVWATVSVTSSVVHQPTQNVLVDTDQTFARTTIGLGNYVSQKQVPFAYSRLMESQSVNLCGVVVEKQLFCQQVYKQIEVPFEEVVDSLKAQALQQATNQANFEVTCVNYQIENNVVAVTVFGNIDIATNTK